MNLKTRDMILIGAFAALAAVSAILVRFGGEAIVPFSPMPFIALISGLMLGSRRGALAMLIYALVGLVGVPVFASPPFGGPQYVLQPTFGFLLGFIAAAYVCGKILEMSGRRTMSGYVIAAVAGVAVIYAVGLPYLWAIFNFVIGTDVLAKAGGTASPIIAVAKIGFIPYIGFDLVKMILAASVARAVGERVSVAVPGAS